MKFSEVKGDRVFDVTADCIGSIANIAADEDAVALFKREKLPEGMTATAFAWQRVKSSVPSLLRNHKADLIAILASIEGVSQEEYTASLDLLKLYKDISELFTDEAVARLFTSAQIETDTISSGSAPESTKGN